MIYSKLKIYFKTHLKTPSIDFVWSSDDNTDIYNYLQEQFPNEDLQSEENKLDIKQAFKEYFEPVGYILLTNKDNVIRIKVFPYTVKPEDSVYVDPIIDILEDNESLIEYDYNGKEDLISINRALRDAILEFAQSIENEPVNRKDLVKFAIREAFELEERDIVIIRSDQIIIKMLDELSINDVSDDEKNTIANRFNGINEDDLKSFYDDIFSKEENQDFFYFVAEEFVDINLIENKIDNPTYEKNVFPIIQSIITEQLINNFDYNDEFFKGFSGYIFRIHFKEVFGYIAELILAELSEGNLYIHEFLKYYSLDVVVLNGKKYQVPAIEAENGWKWNVASMMSIVKVYMKADMALVRLEDDMEELNNEIIELNVAGVSPLAYNTDLNKEIDKIKQEISYSVKRLDECLDSFSASGDNTKHKNEVRDIRHEIKRLREEKLMFDSKKLGSDIIMKYTDLKRSLDTMIRQETREEKIVEQNSEAFGLIKDALTKALTSKKTLVR